MAHILLPGDRPVEELVLKADLAHRSVGHKVAYPGMTIVASARQTKSPR